MDLYNIGFDYWYKVLKKRKEEERKKENIRKILFI